MNQRYNDNIKRPKLQDTWLEILKMFTFCWKIQQWATRERCWSYLVSAFKNTPTNIKIQEREQLKHSSHINKVGVQAICLLFNPLHTFGTMPQEPWHPEEDDNLHCVIQLNCRKVCTHPSYKTTKALENFNNQRTNMILLLEKL